MPRVKSVREPDAGNPHVRFDERRGGNGPWVRLGEREKRKLTLVAGADKPARYRASRRLYSPTTGFGPEMQAPTPFLRGRRLESGGLICLGAAAIEPAAGDFQRGETPARPSACMAT
jgi:hypothetical protein